MKIEKNKIVFAALLLTTLLFLIGYALMIMDKGHPKNEDLKNIPLPALTEKPKDYKSKLDAVNDIKEERERPIPSLYEEKGFDSLGYYNNNYEQVQKQVLIDSLSETNPYASEDFDQQKVQEVNPPTSREGLMNPYGTNKKDMVLKKELALKHALFFAASPASNEVGSYGDTDQVIYAEVDGDQVVKTDYRLRMRLLKPAVIKGHQFPLNSPLYGFVTFKPNRVIIEVQNIGNHPVRLKGFDITDGSEGIYIPNSFRAEASREVADDLIQDINIPGVPQVKGITKVLRRNNRHIKAKILGHYKLILKPKQ